MFVKDLIKQLNFLVNENYINENDIVFCLGSGKEKHKLFKLGVVAPRMKVKIDKSENEDGFIGIGFARIDDIGIEDIGIFELSK